MNVLKNEFYLIFVISIDNFTKGGSAITKQIWLMKWQRFWAVKKCPFFTGKVGVYFKAEETNARILAPHTRRILYHTSS
jgi:hypothetical protein